MKIEPHIWSLISKRGCSVSSPYAEHTHLQRSLAQLPCYFRSAFCQYDIKGILLFHNRGFIYPTNSLAAAPHSKMHQDFSFFFFLFCWIVQQHISSQANVTCKQHSYLFHNRFSRAKQKSRANSLSSRIWSSLRRVLWAQLRWIGWAYVLIKIIGKTANLQACCFDEWFI